jgi:prepilin-type N-terminal cleavage/methylation domain-containing protein
MQSVNAMSHRQCARALRGGFTLIELLVVIFIIIVLVAITVPALASVRVSARVSETRGLISGLSQACQAYELDRDTTPGLFSARDMGRQTNETSGFSGMQNVMLALAGGFNTQTANPGPGWYRMGPDIATDGAWAWVNPDLVGAANATGKQYFTPTARNWRVIDGTEFGNRQSSNDIKRLPELVDAFGTPILAWNEDTTAPKKFTTAADFAKANSGASAERAARFYRANNAAFLTQDVRVGTKAPNQNSSLLAMSRADNQIQPNLTAFLGNPASSTNANDVNVALADVLPSASRAGVVIHSAGKDGVYLSETDKGAAVRGTTPQLYYGLNFRTNGNGQLTDTQGRATSVDIISGFDDLIQAAGT